MEELKAEFVCRTCLSCECQQYKSLSSVVTISDHDAAEPEFPTILDCLHYCLQLDNLQSTELPQYICVKCFSSLCSCYEFIKMAKHSAEKLLATTTQVQAEVEDVNMLEFQSKEVRDSVMKSEGVEVVWLKPIEQRNSLELGNEEYVGLLEENEDEQNSRDDLSRHGIGKHKVQDLSYGCEFCVYKTNYKQDLRKHYRKKHKKELAAGQLAGKDLAIIALKCRSTKRRRLQPFQCHLCTVELNSRSDLKIHYRKKHSMEPPVDQLRRREFISGINTFSCELCTRDFQYSENLQLHYKRHHKISEYFYMHQPISQEGNETNTEQIRDENLPLEELNCQLCKYKAESNLNLDEHYGETHKILQAAQVCHNRYILECNTISQRDLNTISDFEEDELIGCIQYEPKDNNSKINETRSPFFNAISTKEMFNRIHAFMVECEVKEANEKSQNDADLCEVKKTNEDSQNKADLCQVKEANQESQSEAELFCTVCPYKSTDGLALKRHYMCEHPPQDVESNFHYMCEICEFESVNKMALKRHYSYKHKIEPSEDQLKSRNLEECAILESFKKRMCAVSRDNSPNKCKVCKFKCLGQNNMKLHCKSQHGFNLDSEELEQWDNSTTEFPTQDANVVKEFEVTDQSKEGDRELTEDRKSTTVDNEQVSLECIEIEFKKTFNNDSNTYSAPISVEDEDKANYEYDSLDSPQDNNTNEELLYDCEICVYKTNYKQDLRVHYRRKHKKELAEGKLAGLGDFIALKRRSTKRRRLQPFQCQLCTVEMNSRFNLKIHYRRKHKMVPPDDQLKRRESNSGINNFSCELCTRDFQYSKNLQLHYKRRHKISAYFYMHQSISQNGNETNTEQIRDENLPSDELNCQLCEYKAKSNLKLDEHYGETHKILQAAQVCHNRYILECDMISHKDLNTISATELEEDDSIEFIQYEPKDNSSKINEAISSFFNAISTKEMFNRIHAFMVNDLYEVKEANEESQNEADLCEVKEANEESQNEADLCEVKDTNEESQNESELCAVKEAKQESQNVADLCEGKEANEKSQNEAEALKTVFQCDVCQLGFRTSYLLESHLVEHKELEKLRCRICDYECRHSFNMSRHYKFKHDIIPTDEMVTREQEISAHSKSTPSPQDAASLPQQTNEQEPLNFMCSKCSKGKRTLKALKNHEKKCGKESEDRIFKCAMCSASFFDNVGLKMHIDAVHNDRVHKCEICNRAYKTLQYLISHMKRHEKIRPFKCDQCSRSYIREAELRVHRRVHTGELPFGCDICAKRFRKADRLTTHREKMHLELTYKCTQCSEEFNTKHKLRLHLYKHNGTPYKCEVCFKDFIKRHQFRRHMEFVHATSISDEELAVMFLKNMKHCNRFDVFSLGIAATKIENTTNNEN